MSVSSRSEKTNTLAQPQPCDVCGAKVTELRRGRCWGCYTTWAETRPVGVGAACIMCNDRRREHLRSMELLGSWLPCCHNCAARAARLMPMPDTIEAIRQTLTRDRRDDERRVGKADTRVFKRDRRGLERRQTGHAAGDDLMLLGDDDILIVEAALDDGGMLPSEETRILMSPETSADAAAGDRA